MRENNLIIEVIQEIKKGISVLAKIDKFYRAFTKNELVQLGKNKVSAIVLAEIMVDYYTCIETIFLRISRFFENSLQQDKWHSELLNKMTLEIADARIPVIHDKTHSILLEFMKFRHFKRYYFDFDYDWDKLEFLEKKYNQVKPLLEKDLKSFIHFLENLGGLFESGKS